MPSAVRVLAALVAGLIVGTAITRIADPTLLAVGSILEPVGAIWINAIRVTVMPLVVSLLISRIGAERVASAGRVAAARSPCSPGSRSLRRPLP